MYRVGWVEVAGSAGKITSLNVPVVSVCPILSSLIQSSTYHIFLLALTVSAGTLQVGVSGYSVIVPCGVILPILSDSPNQIFPSGPSTMPFALLPYSSG